LGEHSTRREALERECSRYGLDYNQVLLAQSGEEFGDRPEGRRWWDIIIVAAATTVFLYLGFHAAIPSLVMNLRWAAALGGVLIISFVFCGYRLRRDTHFS
jgi:hypothetical protein